MEFLFGNIVDDVWEIELNCLQRVINCCGIFYSNLIVFLYDYIVFCGVIVVSEVVIKNCGGYCVVIGCYGFVFLFVLFIGYISEVVFYFKFQVGFSIKGGIVEGIDSSVQFFKFLGVINVFVSKNCMVVGIQ